MGITWAEMAILAKLKKAGALIVPDAPAAIYEEVLSGRERDAILTLCLTGVLRRIPTPEEEARKESIPGVLEGYQNLLAIAALRLRRTNVLDFILGDSIADAKAKVASQRAQELSAKNSAGTVSELAQRFGVSKSEIRRRRAEGTLDSFIEAQEKA